MVLLLHSGRCYEAEICVILFLLRCPFMWYPSLLKSKFPHPSPLPSPLAGLDLGRECLKKWGYRRCEDICWVKSNSKNPGKIPVVDQKAVLQNTKEHCLMGIKGTVRRNQDGHFIHANIDLDIIITEEVATVCGATEACGRIVFTLCVCMHIIHTPSHTHTHTHTHHPHTLTHSLNLAPRRSQLRSTTSLSTFVSGGEGYTCLARTTPYDQVSSSNTHQLLYTCI